MAFVTDARADSPSIERGRYLAIIAGCNDCHTPGYAARAGQMPESEWLKGDPVGWYGPWGTTYAINIRKLVASLSPEAWTTLARNSKARPPMPAYILRTMTDTDLQSVYLFIRSLGAAGSDVPASLPPGEKPKTPYINVVPQNPEK